MIKNKPVRQLAIAVNLHIFLNAKNAESLINRLKFGKLIFIWNLFF